MSRHQQLNRRQTYALAAILSGCLVLAIVAATLPRALGAVPTATTSVASCTVDPKHKKLQDQEKDEGTEPWKRQGTKQVTVYFAYGTIPPEYKTDVIYSAKQWSRSSCIEAKAVKSCPSNKNCVKIAFKRSGGTNVNGSCRRTFEGNYITEGRISLNSTNTSTSRAAYLERVSTILHEMGHCLGLDHRKTPSLMAGKNNDDYTKPDKVDFQNLRVMYGK